MFQQMLTAQSGSLGCPGHSNGAHLGKDDVDGTGRRGDVGLEGELLALGHDCLQLLIQDLLGDGAQVVHQLIHRPEGTQIDSVGCI